MRSLEEELEDARLKYRNWSRWGGDDALGTLNHIDDAARARAAGLVRTGRAFSLAQEYNRDGPPTGAHGRANPLHAMIESGLDAAADVQGFGHGYGCAQGLLVLPLQSGTRWDGLGHVFDRKKAWNGRDCDEAVTGAVGGAVNPIAVK